MKTSVYRIPYLVGSLLGLLVLAGCAGTAGPATVAAQPIAAKLEPFVAGNTLAGAVMLVADKDKVLDVETVGFADIAGKKPMKPDTLFWIASQSKAMTAAALMMLVDEGKVSLNDPVEKYLPEFGGQMLAVERDADHVVLRKPSRAVTVREVLSHTSGLPFASAMEQPTLDGLPLRDAVRSYAMTPLQYPPGTKYQYSNAGVNTAGRIIEVVSGMPYEKFMQDRLFGPLGMTDTTFWPSERQVNRLAKSYRPNKDKTGLEEQPISQLQYPLWDRTRRFPMPAGGLFSTAGDTAKFCRMLLSGGTFNGRRLLSEDAVKQMTSKQTGPQVNDSYGLGLSVGPDWFGHGGAHSTNMQIDRKRGLIFIWMVQHAGFPGNGGQSQGVFTQAAMEKFAPVATGH
jgi:CubicO group peptidase (beta-lactamase class C family)